MKLPDGRVQIVSYIADANGYKAEVRYAKDDDITPQPVLPTPKVAPTPPAPPQPSRPNLDHYRFIYDYRGVQSPTPAPFYEDVYNNGRVVLFTPAQPTVATKVQNSGVIQAVLVTPKGQTGKTLSGMAAHIN